MTGSRGYKFVTTLVLESKKIEIDEKQNMTLFIHTQKQKQLLMKVTLMMYLNQSILRLYQTSKHFQEKVQAGLLS